MKHATLIFTALTLAACSESVAIRPEDCNDTRTCDTGVAPLDAVMDSTADAAMTCQILDSDDGRGGEDMGCMKSTIG